MCNINALCFFFRQKRGSTTLIQSLHVDVMMMFKKNGSKTPKCQGAINKKSLLLFSWLKTVPSFSFKTESAAFCEGNGRAKTKCSLAVGDNLGVESFLSYFV